LCSTHFLQNVSLLGDWSDKKRHWYQMAFSVGGFHPSRSSACCLGETDPPERRVVQSVNTGKKRLFYEHWAFFVQQLRVKKSLRKALVTPNGAEFCSGRVWRFWTLYFGQMLTTRIEMLIYHAPCVASLIHAEYAADILRLMLMVKTLCEANI